MDKHMFSMRRVALLLVMLALIVAACDSGGSAVEQPTPLPQDALRLLFTYGSEKDAWVKAVTQTFNASNQRIASGKRVVVEPVPAGSVESGMDIVEGRTQPASVESC
jgi:Ca-activated chloride channel family protein